MIRREHYLAEIRPFYDSDLIKIITGVRRCGKSVIKDQIEQELRSMGKPTLSLDFEHLSVSSQITDAQELVNYVVEHLQTEKTYVFLDEVQTVKDWNIACRSLRLENLSLFITGSNSDSAFTANQGSYARQTDSFTKEACNFETVSAGKNGNSAHRKSAPEACVCAPRKSAPEACGKICLVFPEYRIGCNTASDCFKHKRYSFDSFLGKAC